MNGLNQYRNYQIDTSSPEDSIVLLYDGTRRFVDQAQAALEAGDLYQVSQKTSRAQRILSELMMSLNLEVDISKNLAQLYEYWIWRLGQGLIKQDTAAYKEVSNALGEMREAWAEAARQVRAERSGVAAHG